MIQIVTSYFARDARYEKLFTAFERSLRATMPNVQLHICKVKPIEQVQDKKVAHHADCAEAFIAKATYALGATMPTIVCDCDLLFLKSVEDIETFGADIIYTDREWKHPYNSGFWFMRPGRFSRAFVTSWVDWTRRLYREFPHNMKQIRVDAGIDQAALRIVVENVRGSVKVMHLPCQEWNATQIEWPMVDGQTRVVHIKSDLRDALLDGKEPCHYSAVMDKAVELWRKYVES